MAEHRAVPQLRRTGWALRSRPAARGLLARRHRADDRLRSSRPDGAGVAAAHRRSGQARRLRGEVSAELTLDLVWHRPARRTEVAQRRIWPEIRHARRVEVRVVVDLLAEPRVFVAL